jgi:hypothetical protein
MTAESSILLMPGQMTKTDRVGHHDYLGGCTLLAELLQQTAGVRAAVVREGWPDDERVLDAADALVFYHRGREQPFLESNERAEKLQRLIDRGVGLVALHQAVRFARKTAKQPRGWLGGVHVVGDADRGHWRTHHREFPEHPVTRGVPPWTIRDGWLREIHFVEGLRGVTPLLWSGREHAGAATGGSADIVAWAYDRPGGGRSFCYTGVDAHSAWSLLGVRRLVLNGILWSAAREIPPEGSSCAIDRGALRSHLTPRDPWRKGIAAGVRSWFA